ncbi:MAG: hypothetical protein MJZ61_05695 [Bacteroidales bacterium]|nr:hypothetical protein [Bacteroidales bacterium]
MRRLYFSLFVLACLCALAACSGDKSGQNRHQNLEDDIDNTSKPVNYVFSLFTNTGKDGYQIYRNSDKFVFFNIDESRRVVDMRAYNGDCYLLISEGMRDSVPVPAEIYKNGRPAIAFDRDFSAVDFDMEGGHFYVLGHYGDTVTVVFKDGARVFSTGYSSERPPVAVSISGQDIYMALQGENSVDVYKNDTKVYTYDGKCVDLRVSMLGIFMLAEDNLYRDSESIMKQEYYRYADKEMLAYPSFISLSERNCFVGSRSHILNHDEKYYACVFLNRQSYLTVKPDDKPIGVSPSQTYCAGVAICNEDVYTAVVKLNENGEPVQPLVYTYYFDNAEIFDMEFATDAKLLFMESIVI